MHVNGLFFWFYKALLFSRGNGKDSYASHANPLLTPQHCPPCFLPPRSDPGSVPEPRRPGASGRGNAWARPRSGSRIIRRLAQRLPLTTESQSQRALRTVPSADRVLRLNSKALPNISLLSKRVIWLEKDGRHCWFTPLCMEGFYPPRSPLLFIQISSEVRGVWFPVIGLMTFICFATVWLSSIWWPPERFGSINAGIPENSPVWRSRSLSCWPCWKEEEGKKAHQRRVLSCLFITALLTGTYSTRSCNQLYRRRGFDNSNITQPAFFTGLQKSGHFFIYIFILYIFHLEVNCHLLHVLFS